MRALSCLADWQHDIALTPNTATLHPNDAILKTMAVLLHKHNSACVCVRVCVEGRESGVRALIVFILRVHARGRSNFII